MASQDWIFTIKQLEIMESGKETWGHAAVAGPCSRTFVLAPGDFPSSDSADTALQRDFLVRVPWEVHRPRGSSWFRVLREHI